MKVKITHFDIEVGTGSTQVLPPNPKRVYLFIQNDSDTDIYLNVTGSSAKLNNGIRLKASAGNSFEGKESGGNLPLDAIHAICSGANKVLIGMETELVECDDREDAGGRVADEMIVPEMIVIGPPSGNGTLKV